MGLLAAKQLCSQGAKVVLTDVNAPAVEAAAQSIREAGGEALGMTVDIRDYEQVENATRSALEKFRSIDLLLNFAGCAEGSMQKCTAAFH